jgi:3-hydroxyacyl-CoA dehydrogenase/enoyl-CoA hydratase/3-hydroxybutyryl-CoA epimerase
VSLATGQIAKNMINAFFFELQAINAGASRPAGVPEYRARKVGVLGAGMMGAGIAYVCAKVGIEVVLKDVSLTLLGLLWTVEISQESYKNFIGISSFL